MNNMMWKRGDVATNHQYELIYTITSRFVNDVFRIIVNRLFLRYFYMKMSKNLCDDNA